MLRIGTVPFLVARPLTAGLKARADVELTIAPPSRLASLLKAGHLDLALASSILSLEHPELQLWTSGPVIATRDAIRSVLLFLRPGLCGPEKVQHLLTDPASRTGAALSRILLQDLWQAEFKHREAGFEEDPFDADVDAVQLIGDAALEATIDQDAWRVLDLGRAWRELTQQPFVFAGWIGRAGFDPAQAGDTLHAAAELGLSQRNDLIAEGVESLGMDKDFLKRYLMQDVVYLLGESEIEAALSEFGRRLDNVSQPAESR